MVCGIYYSVISCAVIQYKSRRRLNTLEDHRCSLALRWLGVSPDCLTSASPKQTAAETDNTQHRKDTKNRGSEEAGVGRVLLVPASLIYSYISPYGSPFCGYGAIVYYNGVSYPDHLLLADLAASSVSVSLHSLTRCGFLSISYS